MSGVSGADAPGVADAHFGEPLTVRQVDAVAQCLHAQLDPKPWVDEPGWSKEVYRMVARETLDSLALEEPMSVGKEQLQREVLGAMKSAIHAHGPITRLTMTSAAKRITGQLYQRIDVMDAEIAHLTRQLDLIRAKPEAK